MKHAAEERHRQQASPTPPSPLSVAASPQVAAAVVQRGRKKKNKRIVDLDGGDDSGESGQDRSSSKEVPPKTDRAPSPTPKLFMVASSVMQPKRVSRHGRSNTESYPSVDITPELSNGGSFRASRLKAAASRRARASTSLYEPSGKFGEDNQPREADAFRERIERLKADMGDDWLKVLNQSQLGSPPVTSG